MGMGSAGFQPVGAGILPATRARVALHGLVTSFPRHPQPFSHPYPRFQPLTHCMTNSNVCSCQQT